MTEFDLSSGPARWTRLLSWGILAGLALGGCNFLSHYDPTKAATDGPRADSPGGFLDARAAFDTSGDGPALDLPRREGGKHDGRKHDGRKHDGGKHEASTLDGARREASLPLDLGKPEAAWKPDLPRAEASVKPDSAPASPDGPGSCVGTAAVWSSPITVGNTAYDYKTALILDKNEEPIIAYHTNSGSAHVRVALSSTAWAYTDLNTNGSPNTYSWLALALDSSGYPHVSYHYICNLEHAYWTSGGLQYQTLQGSATSMSMAIDSTDKVTIVYTSGPNGGTGTPLAWTGTANTWANPGAGIPGTDSGNHPALVLDPKDSNRPHLFYFVAADLYHAWPDASSVWKNGIVASVGSAGCTSNQSCGFYPSAVVDSSTAGTLYVAYHDNSTSTSGIKLSKGSGYAATGYTWSKETVSSGAGLAYPSLAMSPTGAFNISYYSTSAGHLMYARREASASSWTTGAIDSSTSVGKFSSLAIASSKKAHLIYLDEPNHAIKYLTHACQ
jgi:hypothetical protein